MKRNRKYNIFGWLAASALLLTTACADNATYDLGQGDINAPNNTVTFTVMPQYQIAATRAAGDLDTQNKTIGLGQKANVLIFTVYEEKTGEDGTTTYTPVKEFYKNNKVPGFEAKGQYQNAIDFNGEPVTLQFVVTDSMKNNKYRVAFWAQNKETKAYDTKDLLKVQVNYTDEAGENMLNNDEARDAFCAVSEPFDSETRDVKTVTLRRPLAQINVGTVGWDYEGAAALKPVATSYTESTITLRGVAQFYDVVHGKALVDEKHEKAKVTFKYSTIPAFINVSEDSLKNHLTYKPFECEEYLKVKLYSEEDEPYINYVGWGQFDEYRQGITGGTHGYTTEDDTKTKYTNDEYPETEVFKYLSMSYVLVPEEQQEEQETPEAEKSLAPSICAASRMLAGMLR